MVTAAVSIAMMLAMAGGPDGAPEPATAATSHVRALSGRAHAMVDEGVRRSPTIAKLVGALQASDVIVFVDLRLDPGIPTGETMLMTSSKSVRYVLIVINPRMTLDSRVEYLGHELQHAVEIADDRAAVDGPSVRRRFAEIGRELPASTRYEKSFETEGARQVTLAVRRELASRAPGGSAPH